MKTIIFALFAFSNLAHAAANTLASPDIHRPAMVLCQDPYNECQYRCPINQTDKACQLVSGSCAAPKIVSWSFLRDGLRLIGTFEGTYDMQCILIEK
jgi:hypothetical protein